MSVRCPYCSTKMDLVDYENPYNYTDRDSGMTTVTHIIRYRCPHCQTTSPTEKYGFCSGTKEQAIQKLNFRMKGNK